MVGRRRLLRDAIRRQLHGQVGGVLGELPLREPDLQVDVAPGLLQQTVPLGRGLLDDALLLGGDLFPAPRAQGVDLPWAAP